MGCGGDTPGHWGARSCAVQSARVSTAWPLPHKRKGVGGGGSLPLVTVPATAELAVNNTHACTRASLGTLSVQTTMGRSLPGWRRRVPSTAMPQSCTPSKKGRARLQGSVVFLNTRTGPGMPSKGCLHGPGVLHVASPRRTLRGLRAVHPHVDVCTGHTGPLLRRGLPSALGGARRPLRELLDRGDESGATHTPRALVGGSSTAILLAHYNSVHAVAFSPALDIHASPWHPSAGDGSARPYFLEGGDLAGATVGRTMRPFHGGPSPDNGKNSPV